MYPGTWAEEKPDALAVVMTGSGETRTWKQLDDRSNQLAQLWWAAGLRPRDHVALFTDNRAEFFDVAWAALRSSLYLTPVNRYLTAEEAAYIVNDCGATSIVVSGTLSRFAELAARFGLADRCAELEPLVTPFDGQFILETCIELRCSVAWLLGGLARAQGRRDEAVAHYERALAFETANGAVLMAQRTRADLERVRASG